MQEIVGNRLPKFTKEEVKMVKGSIDFVGINQYTAYYMYDPHQSKPKVLGMDDPGNVTLSQGLHDTTRINYYKAYLTQLRKAVDDGANVVGYFAWSLLDNFEWRLGYTSRFGIVYVDFSNLKRYPKMSAYWFKQLLTRKKH
ncbi:Glycoside hydrolase family 1 - like 9 [Theobroma cacao]|nr:Glycoside hydrolase family 1 - like 9 [Theobroma cacao]